MGLNDPGCGDRLDAGTRELASWDEARQRLEDAQFYWFATVSAHGGPHLMPMLAVWVDGELHFCTNATSLKGRNLARSGRCSVGIDSDDLHLIVEGLAAPVTDLAALERVAESYRAKYGWEPTVRDGALHADGAPTAGSPSYTVYAVRPSKVFGLGTDDTFGATRWHFPDQE